MKLSAVFVTLNEERNLPRALRSADFCDEIVVVDSGSTDATVEIARAAGARVLQQPWLGYAKQKNFAAEAAAHDWILALDADEEVGPELRRELLEVARGEPRFSAYEFPRRARYLGRWIRHSGWYPDRKARLYDRRRARWEGDYVHESVCVEGPTGRLNGDLLHYTCDSLSSHIERLNRYTSLAAAEAVERGARPGASRWTAGPAWAFVKSYVFKRGFLDGRHGFLIAWMAAFYVFSKHVKTWERRRAG